VARLRLHTGGKFRSWLGRRFGGDAELGDRVWRRILHGLGVLVLLYYILPARFFILLTTEEVLLVALLTILALEALRLFAGLEMPTIREYERRRMASYAFYAIALSVTVLVFPPVIGVVVVLGVAFVDPLIGELRRRPGLAWSHWLVPIVVYIGLATAALVLAFAWDPVAAFEIGVLLAVVAVAVERPRIQFLDDDIAMTLVPAVLFALILYVVPGLPGHPWGP
jgi:hypothetical protein